MVKPTPRPAAKPATSVSTTSKPATATSGAKPSAPSSAAAPRTSAPESKQSRGSASTKDTAGRGPSRSSSPSDVHSYVITATGGTYSRREYADGTPVPARGTEGYRDNEKGGYVRYRYDGQRSIKLTAEQAASAKLAHLKLVRGDGEVDQDHVKPGPRRDENGKLDPKKGGNDEVPDNKEAIVVPAVWRDLSGDEIKGIANRITASRDEDPVDSVDEAIDLIEEYLEKQEEAGNRE